MSETCTIKIRIEDELDNYREEDIVKNVWPYMTPWFTRRHGVSSGKIQLNNGIFIDWKYETDYAPEYDEDTAIEAASEAIRRA